MDKALNSISRPLPSEASDWLHLVPAGTFSGADGRGPFVVKDVEALISASMAGGRKLPIDENHSIDLVGAKGGASPARGWIVELQARADGIWGRVEWTAEGRKLVEEKSYGFLSPVFLHSKGKPHSVGQLLRVALTNDPNLTQLTALHHSKDSEMDKDLRKALGLPEDADDAAVLEAVTTAHAASTAHTALMARLVEVAEAEEGATADELVTSLQAKVANKGDDEAEDLRKQVKSLNTQLTQVMTTTAKKEAEAAIDAAIEGGRLVPALRDHMIARHMKNPAEVETELKAMPSLRTGSLHGFKPSGDGDEAGLSPEDTSVCAMMGLDPKAYAETSKKLERSAL